MTHIWACTCHTETEVEPKTFKAGSVFRCPGCGKTFGCVRGLRGNKAWMTLQDNEVEFHDLLKSSEVDEFFDQIEWEIAEELSRK